MTTAEMVKQLPVDYKGNIFNSVEEIKNYWGKSEAEVSNLLSNPQLIQQKLEVWFVDSYLEPTEYQNFEGFLKAFKLEGVDLKAHAQEGVSLYTIVRKIKDKAFNIRGKKVRTVHDLVNILELPPIVASRLEEECREHLLTTGSVYEYYEAIYPLVQFERMVEEELGDETYSISSSTLIEKRGMLSVL